MLGIKSMSSHIFICKNNCTFSTTIAGNENVQPIVYSEKGLAFVTAWTMTGVVTV